MSDRPSVRSGVGRSENPNSYDAGRQAAQQAMTGGGHSAPELALLFCTSRHEPAKVRDGVRSVIGPSCTLAGGYTVGIITHASASYDGHEVGVALLEGPALSTTLHVEQGLAGREDSVGEALGRKIAAGPLATDSSVILLYDSVHHVGGVPKLNMATPLLSGLAQHLKPWPLLAGMGMIGDMQLQPTFQFANDEILQQSALAVVFHASISMSSTIMHGCRPAGRYHEITKAEGPLVLEIDGRPAVKVIEEMLGSEYGLTQEDFAFFVTLGVNKGDQFGQFREDDYANRMCIGVDADRQALIMFENDLLPGTQIQLMRRSVDFSYIGPRTEALFAQVAAAGRTPVLAFYIDCAGRAGAYCGMDSEEADVVRKHIPASVPLLGVYSGVEIAQFKGEPQALDWTGVLCVFSV